MADTERLLAKRGTHPDAPAVQHALASLLDNAAGPPSHQELAGEVAAVAAFMLVTGHRDTRHDRGGNRFLIPARRGRAITAAVGAAILLAFSGAAAANALPAPIQELAHRTFDAPAPHHATPTTPSSGHGHSGADSEADPSPSAQGHRGKAKAVGQTKSPTESAHGKAKGHTAPPGHQKSTAPPGHQKS